MLQAMAILRFLQKTFPVVGTKHLCNMKKTLFLISLLTILLSGCNKEDALNLLSTNFPTVTAGFEQNQTRTYVADENLLRWNENDQISFFYGSTLNLQYQFDGEDGDNAGTFSIVNQVVGTGNELDCNYAVYPYSSTNKITESGVISACLPATQNYEVNSFGLGANTMVAATQDKNDTFLKFKNVGGYLKLLLFGDDVTVKTITLTGNSNEQIAGNATITTSNTNDPFVNMANDATEAITLDCGSGVKIGTSAETATAFWIVVPPTSFEDGFNVTIRDINGYEITKSTSNKIDVERNRIKPMDAFKVEIMSNNQIWYTSSDGNIIEPNDPSAFGTSIKSNVYKDGKGIITFDSDLTTIGDEAFYACWNLTSVIIPNSVETIGASAFAECLNLPTFEIPNSVTTISMGAFYSCFTLSNITFGNGVVSIGSSAFEACESLTNIDIPNSVKTIGMGAFYNCTGLESVIIPESINSIECVAFSGCINLSSVYCKASVPPTAIKDRRGNWNSFDNCASNLQIYVPQESLSAYQSADSWSKYADKIVINTAN